jgi:ammonia channel protein AmtB
MLNEAELKRHSEVFTTKMSAFDCSKYNATGDENLVLLCGDMNSYEELLQSDINNFFILWAGSLVRFPQNDVSITYLNKVIFMHAGFAMLSAGAVRSKNTRNILLSISMDICVCAIGWYLVGFAFAFGQDKGGFIGTTYWVGIDVGSTPTGGTSFYFWFFQFAFAATAATIVSGAISERARFDTYLCTSAYMSVWCYPLVAHWVWGGGFLTLGNPTGHSIMSSGVVDFAGCGPVHMVGGVAGMMAAIFIGKCALCGFTWLTCV